MAESGGEQRDISRGDSIIVTVEPHRDSLRWDAIVFVGVCLLFIADAWNILNGVQTYSLNGVPGITADRCALVVGVAMLLILRFARGGKMPASVRFDIAIGAICGALFFSRTIGISLIDPQNIQWLLRGDWAAHYASWESYRSAPWTWPPGANPNVWFPVGTSVVFTDSLPLVAIPLKAIRAFLPQPFQYIGFVFAINFVMQGICAALLMRRANAKPAAVLTGCLLFLFAPVLIWRVGHDTLTAQWLILAAFLLYFRDPVTSRTRELLPWLVITFVAATVHPYFPPMIMAIAFASWVRRVHVDQTHTWLDAWSAISSMVAVTLFAWWMTGALTIPPGDASGGIASGIYTSNVLTFVSSAGFSRIIPAIPNVPIEQWEGAAYFGFGMMLLMIVVIADALIRRRARPSAQWPLIVVAILFGLFAISTAVRVGPWQLTDWKSQVPLLESYRASGRFIWVPFYGLLLFALWQTLRAFPRAGSLILAATLALQMWDFAPIHMHFAALRSGVSWPAPEKLLTAPEWDSLLAHRHHVIMLPPVACGVQAGSYLPFQLLAAKHAATFNSGYVARWNSKATAQYCGQLHDDEVADRYSVDDVYVVGADMIDAMHRNERAHCQTLDTFTVCIFDGT